MPERSRAYLLKTVPGSGPSTASVSAAVPGSSATGHYNGFLSGVLPAGECPETELSRCVSALKVRGFRPKMHDQIGNPIAVNIPVLRQRDVCGTPGPNLTVATSTLETAKSAEPRTATRIKPWPPG